MHALGVYLLVIEHIISGFGVVIITAGAMRAAYHVVAYAVQGKVDVASIRLQLGESIILGLEFMVGSDILGTVREPDYHDLGILGILVVIRTVLSYFLNKELTELSPQEQAEMRKQL